MSTPPALPSPMGQAALQYVRRGWPVFPCRERDEQAFVRGEPRTFRAKAPYTGSGLKDATTDEQRINAWWRQHPDALIGVPMGVNGCFALDFDPRVDPDTGEVFTLERLKADLETMIGVPLPRSLTSMTQSGGVHVWFKQPDDGGEPIKNRGNLPEHVDVRGQGGYVVAAPSITYDAGGNPVGRYRWLADRGDWRDDADIADAPGELIEILRSRGKRGASSSAAPPPARSGGAALPDVDDVVRKYALSALDGECREIRGAGSGKRNEQLFTSSLKVSSLVAAGAIEPGLARAMVEAAARDNPGRDDDGQLQATINSGWSAGANSPRDLSEIAATVRDRRERRQEPRSSRAAPRPPASGAEQRQPFRSGSNVAVPPMEEVERDRLIAASAAWLKRRIEHCDRTPEAMSRLAFSAGRRIAAELLNANTVKEALWDEYETVAGVTHAMIDDAIEDGRARGFDTGPLLTMMRCARFPLTDFGIAERFNLRHGHDYRFTTAKGWLGWDGRRWKVLDQDKDTAPAEVIAAAFETVRAIQDEARFIADTGRRFALDDDQKRLIEDEPNPVALDYWLPKGKSWELYSTKMRVFGRQSETAGKPNAVVGLSRRWLTVQIEAFDRDPLAINVMNGTLRFRCEATPEGRRKAGFTIEPHAREDLNTRLAPVEYDRDAACPIYDGFFAWAHPDAATRRYLHQVIGYTATGDTGEQALWFHYGLGANGKSTAMDVWAHGLGDYAGTIGIETFLDQGIKKRGEQASPDLARLGGVRLLRASEPERGARLNEALIKAATGGEPMAVRALHRGFFDLVPLFKLHIGGNYKPDIPGTDEGIWRRMKLVPWNAHVEKKDRDGALPDKLKGEVAGIFNHIVAGLIDWLENGLIEPDAVREATEQYREDSDPLARFLKMCTRVDPVGRIQSSKLHEVFVAWCKAAGEKDWTNKGLSKAMSDKGFTKKASDGMQWLGLRLVHTADDFVDENGRAKDMSKLLPVDEAPPHDAPPDGRWGADDDDMLPP